MSDPLDTQLGMDTQAYPTEAAPTQTIQFYVNGQLKTSAAPPISRLSDILRDEFGLTGTKLGCSAGDCGLCTVSLNERQVCACLVPLGQLENQHVITVEGLAKDPLGKRLQNAFHAHGAAQCGICTPGMLMAALDLLRHHERPTEAQVMDALGGVLCRCTGYRKIVEAVLAMADSPSKHKRRTDDLGHVGSRLAKLDGQAKLNGTERFGADQFPKDALSVRVIRSPHHHARFSLNDFVAWANLQPGIKGVVIAKDIPVNRFAIFPELRDQPALAETETRFMGEAVALLVGDAEALQAFRDDDFPVRYQVRAAVLEPEQALAKGAAVVQSRWPDNVLCRGRVMREAKPGALEEALHDGALTLRATMSTPYVEHAYLEPEAGYAQWNAAAFTKKTAGPEPVVTIFACTQTPYMDRDELAHMFNLRPEQVRVIPSAVGGGFGGKLDMSIQPLLVAAARKFGKPVRVVYGRRESMLSTTKRHPSILNASITTDAQGNFVAYDFSGDFNTGAYSSWGPTVANRVPIHACGPYRFPNIRALTRAVLTHNSISGAFRGFGVPQSTLVTEGLIDEIAIKFSMDPLQYRFEQALRAGDQTATGQTLVASVGLQACLDSLRPAWKKALASVASFNQSAAQVANELRPRPASDDLADMQLRDLESDPHRRYVGRKRRGVGIACMWYGIGNTVIANPSSMSVGLRADGRFMLYNGAVDIGQGTYTILPQICAQALGVPVGLFDQIKADTWLTEDAGKSSASRQTFVSGNAAKFAGESLRRKLLSLLGFSEDAAVHLSLDLGLLRGCLKAQHALTKDREDVDQNVLVAPVEDEWRELDLSMMPTDERGDVALGTGHFNPPTIPLDADGQGVPYATYGFAAQFAEVEIDLDLGSVRVLNIHAAHDVGRAINPTQVEGQIHGGIAQGLGLALMEEYVPGKTDNLHDYLIPSVGDIPPITVHLIEDPEPLGPYGAKGVGEPALVATAPAILNAIRHAVGVRLSQVPVTPARMLAALKSHLTARS
jgi:aldehyde oxidoreductase